MGWASSAIRSSCSSPLGSEESSSRRAGNPLRELEYRKIARPTMLERLLQETHIVACSRLEPFRERAMDPPLFDLGQFPQRRLANQVVAHWRRNLVLERTFPAEGLRVPSRGLGDPCLLQEDPRLANLVLSDGPSACKEKRIALAVLQCRVLPNPRGTFPRGVTRGGMGLLGVGQQ
jgi:hypothetical protein